LYVWRGGFERCFVGFGEGAEHGVEIAIRRGGGVSSRGARCEEGGVGDEDVSNDLKGNGLKCRVTFGVAV
jgi:hypothetical protein